MKQIPKRHILHSGVQIVFQEMTRAGNIFEGSKMHDDCAYV